MEKSDLKKPGAFTLPFISIAILAIIFFAYISAPLGSQLFEEYSLTAQIFPELWRSISAHFLHTDGNHLFWNTSVLAICGTYIERQSRLLLIIGWLVGSIVVSGWFVIQSNFIIYAGASGVLNALFVVTVILALWENKPSYLRSLAIIILSLQITKNLVELKQGSALFSQTIWSPTPGAHIAGMLGGGVALLIHYQLKSKLCKKLCRAPSTSRASTY